MICVATLIEKEDLKILKRLGVKDSKVLSHSKIIELASIIPKYAKIEKVYITAEEISNSNKSFNLNDMECKAYCSMAKKFETDNPIEVQINNFDYAREKFINRAIKLGFNFDWKKWRIEHDNETKRIAVGAASIIAKALSLQEYDELKKKVGDFGSANPNDLKTLKWICQNPNSNIIRINWKTYQRLKEQNFKIE